MGASLLAVAKSIYYYIHVIALTEGFTLTQGHSNPKSNRSRDRCGFSTCIQIRLDHSGTSLGPLLCIHAEQTLWNSSIVKPISY